LAEGHNIEFRRRNLVLHFYFLSYRQSCLLFYFLLEKAKSTIGFFVIICFYLAMSGSLRQVNLTVLYACQQGE
ncbi:hypothetical protein, partial [Serratia nevei]|uniref:hypothetical protein n=1 Tax=Serratia nevei TaxID=2703794 RepID=UPI002AA29B94